MPNFVRIIIASVLFVLSVLLFVFSYWGTGILVLLLSILSALTFMYHEYMLLAQYYLRKENFEKAEAFLGKINNYEKQLNTKQYGYYHLLLGLIESRKAPLKAEKFFKKALSLGMVMDHNVALAKLSLAGVAMARRNKREAETLLAEAQKADKNKLLDEQIKMMKSQMKQMDRVVMKGFR